MKQKDGEKERGGEKMIKWQMATHLSTTVQLSNHTAPANLSQDGQVLEWYYTKTWIFTNVS